MESISLSDDDSSSRIGGTRNVHVPISPSSGREEATLDEAEEKAQLINQVLQLQNTLDDLSQRVDAVKDENLKLKSENEILGQYIENLMSASSVFQAAGDSSRKPSSAKSPKKGEKR